METDPSKPQKKSIFLSVHRAQSSLLPTIPEGYDTPKPKNSQDFLSPFSPTLQITIPNNKPKSTQNLLSPVSANTHVPTFGNLGLSPTKNPYKLKIKLEDSEGKEYSANGSDSNSNSATPNKNIYAKRISKRYQRAGTTLFSQLHQQIQALKEPASPSLLNEYKYRGLYSRNNSVYEPVIPGTGKSNTNLSNQEIMSFDQQQTSFSRSFDASQTNSAKIKKSSTRKSSNPSFVKLKSANSQLLSASPLKPGQELCVSNMTTSSSDSSEEEFELLTDHRRKRRRILKRSFFAIYFIGIMFSLRNRVQMYGAIRPIKFYEAFEQEKKFTIERKSFLPLLPTSAFSLLWMLVILSFLITVALFAPVYISFARDDDPLFYNLNLAWDVVFGLDMLITFLTAYFDSRNRLFTSFSQIAFHYLKFWFWIDALAMIPLNDVFKLVADSEFLYATRINKLLRLFRFKRFFSTLKTLRVLKVITLNEKSRFNKVFKALELNFTIMKSLQTFLGVLFLIHFVACIWFFAARVYSFSPDTWVARSGLIDTAVGDQYVAAMCWAFEVFATVGYGDVCAKTELEFLLSILWSVISVGFHSMILGYLSTILFSKETKDGGLKSILGSFAKFSALVRLPEFLRQKIQRCYELNHKEKMTHWADRKDLLKILPANLRTSVLLYSYYAIIKDIKILQIDPNFTSSLLVNIKMLKIKNGEMIYRKDDLSYEIYFIQRGSIQFFTEHDQGIYSLSVGTYFGELEILDEEKRKCFCRATSPTVLLVCPKALFLKTLEDYPAIEAQIERIAQIRRAKVDWKIEHLHSEIMEIMKKNQESPENAIHYPKLLNYNQYMKEVMNEGVERKRKRPQRENSEVIEFKLKNRSQTRKFSMGLGLKETFTKISKKIAQKENNKAEAEPPQLSLMERLRALRDKHITSPKNKKPTYKDDRPSAINTDDVTSQIKTEMTTQSDYASFLPLKRNITMLTENDKSATLNKGGPDMITFDGKLDDMTNRLQTSAISPILTVGNEDINFLEDKEINFEPLSSKELRTSMGPQFETSRSDAKLISYEKSFIFNDLSSYLKSNRTSKVVPYDTKRTQHKGSSAYSNREND